MPDANTDLTGNSRFMDQYSRQIGAFGLETMAKLVRLKVLIVGLQGVGVEVAKNLILAGPASVTLADSNRIQMRDLGANFFFKESEVKLSASSKHSELLMNQHAGQGRLCAPERAGAKAPGSEQDGFRGRALRCCDGGLYWKV